FLPCDKHLDYVPVEKIPPETCNKVWNAFLRNEYPQLAQQEGNFSTVPSTWSPERQAEWCNEFDTKLCSLMPRVEREDIHRAAQLSWGENLPDVLPTTCPPDLMIAHRRQSDKKLCICIPSYAVYQAWMHAWKHMCDKYYK
ncbi:MAG: hypothetical protein LBR89_02265, partial [Holosporales bacterium]|nr:hypothetical protein [Holosporales bacterium]